MSAELQDALLDGEELKNQVQDYIVEVKKAEELLAAKVCCFVDVPPSIPGLNQSSVV